MIRLFKHYVPHAVLFLGFLDFALLIAAMEVGYSFRLHQLGSVVEPAVTPTLSPREYEVLGELARGATYSDIASNLFVSENTVKTHLASIYRKLEVDRRVDALRVARAHGLL